MIIVVMSKKLHICTYDQQHFSGDRLPFRDPAPPKVEEFLEPPLQISITTCMPIASGAYYLSYPMTGLLRHHVGMGGSSTSTLEGSPKESGHGKIFVRHNYVQIFSVFDMKPTYND